MRRAPLALALLACLLLAPAASALYVVTPLRAFADTNVAKVGDTLTVTIEPENETTAAEWAGKLVHAYYAYDRNENAEQPSESPDSYVREPIGNGFTLDGKAAASFTWTVPADANDHNVAIRIESPEGELLAVADVAVGDAPPMMRALGGSAGGGAPEPVQTDMGNAGSDREGEAAESNDVPAPALVAGLAVVVLAALALRRRVG